MRASTARSGFVAADRRYGLAPHYECFVYSFYAEVVVRPLTKGVRERTNGKCCFLVRT